MSSNAPLIVPIPAGSVAVWAEVCDDILSGLTHALNNRLAAVGALARVLEYGESDGPELQASLIHEIEALESTVALLHAVPRTVDDQPEPILLDDLVPTLARLHGLRRGMRDIELVFECEAPMSTAVADPVLLTRALLIALGPLSRAAGSPGTGVVRLSCEAGQRAALVLAVQTPSTRTEADREMEAAIALGRAAGTDLSWGRTGDGSPRSARLLFSSEI